MSKTQVVIGKDLQLTELRLKPEGPPDVLVVQHEDVTNAIRTFDLVREDIEGLAQAQLDEKPMRLILEFDSDD